MLLCRRQTFCRVFSMGSGKGTTDISVVPFGRDDVQLTVSHAATQPAAEMAVPQNPRKLGLQAIRPVSSTVVGSDRKICFCQRSCRRT